MPQGNVDIVKAGAPQPGLGKGSHQRGRIPFQAARTSALVKGPGTGAVVIGYQVPDVLVARIELHLVFGIGFCQSRGDSLQQAVHQCFPERSIGQLTACIEPDPVGPAQELHLPDFGGIHLPVSRRGPEPGAIQQGIGISLHQGRGHGIVHGDSFLGQHPRRHQRDARCQ